jgi:GT2 family glycosyltransferase
VRDLSIVLPTCNRAALLARCLDSLRDHTTCDYEIVAVDGASTDDTSNVLARAKATLGDRLNVIAETRREGFVRAINKGFRAAAGRCVCWMNDDARPVGKSLDNAVEQVDRSGKSVGIVAMYHTFHEPRGTAYEKVVDGRSFRLLHVRGTLYANFGVGLLPTWRSLGFFDDNYYLYGADADFSLKAWTAGYSVVPATDSYVDHDEHKDDRRVEDRPHSKRDIARLSSRWVLPKYRPEGVPFDPAKPCTVRGLSGPWRRTLFAFRRMVLGKIR